MKKLNTRLVIGIIILVTTSFAQSTKTAATYLDLMVNVVSTNVSYGESNKGITDYKKSIRGLQAGATFQAGITPGFSLVTELYFMRKGGKLKANNPLTTNETTLHLNTLEIPVLARFHVGKFYMNAGPSIAYVLSGSRKINDQSNKLIFNNSVGGINRFDAGIQVGAGVQFPLKQKRLALDIRYNYGLTNISFDKEIYNRAIMISVHLSKAWLTNPFGRKIKV
jgi:hypothetical protein